jgi:hypothetical protein
MKKTVSVIILCLLILSGFGASSLSFNYEDFTQDYVYSFEFSPELQFDVVDTMDGFYTSLSVDDEGFTTVVGEAQLPVLYRMVQIPFGSDPMVSVLSESWDDTSLNYLGLPDKVMPLQSSVFKNVDLVNENFVIDSGYYSTNSFMQNIPVEIIDTGIIRGNRFALVQVSPVQYNPVGGQLRILTSLEVELCVDDADLELTSDKIQRYSMKAFDENLEKTLVNYNDFHPDSTSSMVSNLILIIVYDEFADEINLLKSWKESIGYNVVVTKSSEIPGGISTTNLKNYIQTAYDDWNVPPGFVLLVGDTGQIPAFNGDASNSATDLYYVTTDGSDYFADIFIGRFPADQLSHVTAMIDKTIAYESGNWANTDFLDKAAFMAGNDNYHISEGTHNYVIDSYFIPHEVNCDKLYEVTYGATTNDVRIALSDGRILACFSGHGSRTSWADGPTFTQSDVNGLTNIDMLSFVCSHACVTGDYSIGECFGETWIRAPNKAAVIFWGSSANTLWDEDDILEKRTLADFYNYNSVGAMTEAGKLGVYTHYGGGGYTKYYFECYNIFGDPSVIIGFSWTGGGGGGGGGGDGPNWIPPRVGINTPRKNAEVNGTINITGYSYGIEGPIKYVFIQIDGSDYIKPTGLEDWTYSWDTTTLPDGEIYISAVSIDSHGHQSGFEYIMVNITNTHEEPPPPPKISDLTCEGTLTWNAVKPGTLVNGTIYLNNVGDSESLLDWEISEYPSDWGRWAINPSEGEGLTPEQGPITIQVSVEVPNIEETNFSGYIKIVNTQNSSDYDIIDITLSTVKTRSYSITSLADLLNFLGQRFSSFFLFNLIKKG